MVLWVGVWMEPRQNMAAARVMTVRLRKISASAPHSPPISRLAPIRLEMC